MTRGGLAQTESYTWTLDTTHAPRWLDLQVVRSPGEPARFLPGLLQWVGADAAAVQFFALGGSHPTQFQEMFTSKKQFLRRLPSEPAAASSGERVVYRAPQWDGGGLQNSVIFDPEDAESVAQVSDFDISGARQVVWRTPSGVQHFVGGTSVLAPGVTLATKGFMHRRPFIEATPSFLLKNPPPDVKDIRRFVSIRPDGRLAVLWTGLPLDANTRIVSARLVQTVNGDPADPAPTGLYLYAARDFEGPKTLLRAVLYSTTGRHESIDGPSVGIELGQVAYFDRASRRLVMINGEVRDIVSGKVADRIKGPAALWYVDALASFYTLEANESPARAWGVADSKSGAIVAGGKLGAELILSRLEVDANWNTLKVEAARALVPAQGHVSSARTARIVEASRTAAASGTPACPHLAFDPGPDAAGSDWYAMASPAGRVLFFGKLWVNASTHMSVWLVVDPKRPNTPVAVSYSTLGTVSGYPAALGSFPASPDGNLLGIRPFYVQPPQAFAGAPFVLDRSSGTIVSVPTPSWRAK